MTEITFDGIEAATQQLAAFVDAVQQKFVEHALMDKPALLNNDLKQDWVRTLKKVKTIPASTAKTL